MHTREMFLVFVIGLFIGAVVSAFTYRHVFAVGDCELISNNNFCYHRAAKTLYATDKAGPKL